MRVKIRFLGRLQEITGEKEELVEIREEGTVRDVLTKLSKRHGKSFSKYVYGRGSQIANHLQVLLNGTSVTIFQGLETEIMEDAEIDIIPLVAGG